MAVATGVGLFVIMSILLHISLDVSNRYYFEIFKKFAHDIANNLITNIQISMLSSKKEKISLYLETLKDNTYIDEVYIITKSNEVKWSKDKSMIGKHFDRANDAMCSQCHKPDNQKPSPDMTSTITKSISGKEVYAVATPIINDINCRGCHGYTSRILAMAYTTFKFDEVSTVSNSSRYFFITATVITFIISILIINLLFKKLISSPLNKLLQTMSEVQKGNYDVCTASINTSQDEIGQLSRQFDNMLQAIRHYQRQIDEMHINEKHRIIESLPVGIIITDTEYKVIFNNQTSQKILDKDLTSATFEHKPIVGIIREIVVQKTKTIELHTSTIDWQSKEAYLICLIDITRLKIIENELRQAKNLAEQATKAKSQFLANMSHEIRTPLNAIMGLTDIVLMTELTDEQRHYLSTVKNSSQTLLQIINDILDLAKVEAGKIELDEHQFSLRELIQTLKDMFLPETKRKGLDFNITIEGSIPDIIIGDSLRLKQVLVNLLSNAFKFTERGLVELTVKKIPLVSTDMHASTLEDSSQIMLLFSVSDTGIGIPYALQQKIFEEFTQADTSTTRKYGGTGLGLALCKAIVKLMKGKIWVQSEYQKGSTFYFTAIFKVSAGVDATEPSKEKQLITTQDSKGSEPLTQQHVTESKDIHILVAEDNQINQEIMKRLLLKAGYKVTIANNGKEVIDYLHKQRFDMIFMDVQMPELDGIEATKIIRQERFILNSNDIPIVAVTACTSQEDISNCFEVKMNDYLPKPIKAQVLYETIKKWTNS